MFTATAILYPDALATSVTLPMEIMHAAGQMARAQRRDSGVSFRLAGPDRHTLKLASGLTLKPDLPFAPGMEVAGRVTALGDGVEGFGIGQKVAAFVNYGGYADKVVLRNIEFSLIPGERIGLLGLNGAGKSTFIKLLANELQPFEGTVTRAKDLQVGYFAQHQVEQLDLEAHECQVGPHLLELRALVLRLFLQIREKLAVPQRAAVRRDIDFLGRRLALGRRHGREP